VSLIGFSSYPFGLFKVCPLLFVPKNFVIRSQAQFRSSNEPDLLPETAVAELGELLLLFVPEQSSSSLEPTSPSSGGPSGTIAAVDLSSFTIYEHYVAAFVGGGKRPSSSALLPSPLHLVPMLHAVADCTLPTLLA
jgi:hypothetical protein